MNAGAIIGIDWGSTHVRAFRFDDAGAVIETRHSDRGSATLRQSDYEEAARALLDGWLTGKSDRIVICGMAGSRDGWLEASYLACPTSLIGLSQALATPSSTVPALIVPGLYAQDANGVHDVMRGEETQILGAMQSEDAWFILPGTHSKWVDVQDGVIQRFSTYMTGDFYKLLTSHSVLQRTLDANGAFDADAFASGAARGLQGEALTKTVFAVRAQALFNELGLAAAASYLSGLLIGAEIADGLTMSGARRFVVIGAKDIAGLYLKALSLADVTDVAVIDGETAAARGLWRIAREAAR